MGDFTNFRSPVARKEHFCEHCRCGIDAGEKHRYVSGIIEGDFQSYRSHFDCEEASSTFGKVAGLEHDDYHPWLYELGSDDASDREWLAETYPAIHERIQARRKLAKANA